MYPYTRNNHFRFGYVNKADFLPRTAPEELFRASYGPRSARIENWVEANRKAAKFIFDQKIGDLYILLSGGLDSEICLRSFAEAGVPFKAVSARYKGNLNGHELRFVEGLKKEIDFDHEYIDLDLTTFWESGLFLEIVDPIRCVSPILACHLWLADHVSGTPVIAQGEVQLRKRLPPDYKPGVSPYPRSPWDLVESEMFVSLYRHFIFRQRPAIPGFFQFLPEQIWSYLFFNPLLEKLVRDEIPGKLSTRSSKNLMASSFYPQVEPREKYTGFETIWSLQLQKRQALTNRFPNSEGEVLIPLDQLRAQLGGND
jgi:hypothetical protein